MKSPSEKFSCLVNLAIGKHEESLAQKHFVSASEAAHWALATSQTLKVSLGAKAYDRIDDEFVIEISGHIAGDPAAVRLAIFEGTLATATTELAKRVALFEHDTLPKFRIDVTNRIASRAKRRYLIAVAGLGVIVATVIATLLVPPYLDSELAAESILSRPPPEFAGRWGVGGDTGLCDSDYIIFIPRRYEALVGGSRQSFAAAYKSTSADTMSVDYAKGGIRLTQTFRRSALTGHLTIVSVESSEPEIAAAARRAIGTRFSKCPP